MSKVLSPLITGSVKNGKFQADDAPLFKQAFTCHEGQRVSVAVKRYRETRSSNQSRYYFGVIVAMIGDYIGESDPQTIHEMLKAAHNYRIQAVDGKEIRIPQSTADLSTVDFEAYTERVRRWADEFLDLYIPLPREIQIANELNDQIEAKTRTVFPGAKVVR